MISLKPYVRPDRTNGQGSLGEAGTLGRQPATSLVAPRSRPHDEAGDTSKIRSDHASLAGGDRNRRPTRRPALRRRACAPNSKSSARNCPGSPDGTPFSRTAYSQAPSAQSPAQGDRLLKAGIKWPPESILTHWQKNGPSAGVCCSGRYRAFPSAAAVA